MYSVTAALLLRYTSHFAAKLRKIFCSTNGNGT